MSKMNRKLHEQRLYDAAQDTFTGEGGGRGPVVRCAATGVMAAPPTRGGGLSREYRGYRYDVLSDALAYARLLSSRSMHPRGQTVLALHQALVEPTVAQRQLMTSLAIEFDAGAYRFDGRRYAQLSEAVDQANSAARKSTDIGR